MRNHMEACLDKKTRRRVLCGACGSELAQIIEEGESEGGDLTFRCVSLNIAWRRGDDDIWRLPKRTIARLKKGLAATFTVRRQRQWMLKHGGSDMLGMSPDVDARGLSFRIYRTMGSDILVQCWKCQSVQALRAGTLQLTAPVQSEKDLIVEWNKDGEPFNVWGITTDSL